MRAVLEREVFFREIFEKRLGFVFRVSSSLFLEEKKIQI